MELIRQADIECDAIKAELEYAIYDPKDIPSMEAIYSVITNYKGLLEELQTKVEQLRKKEMVKEAKYLASLITYDEE